MSDRPTSLMSTAANAVIAGRGSALQAVPARQAGWVAAQVGVAGLLALTGLWASNPELALSISLGAGAAVVRPQKLFVAPLVTGGVALGGLVSAALDLSPMIGAGAVAGLALAWLLPDTGDWLDYVNGALASAASATIGLWAATHLLPDIVGTFWGPVMGAGVVALVASQALVPLALRFDRPWVPTAREIQKALQVPYRPPVFQAVDLYTSAIVHAPDSVTKRGMAEIASWVFRLQCTLQALDGELAGIDPERIQQRIEACRVDDGDEFTRDRKTATIAHLERLLSHRQAIATEKKRTAALVDYALAFLEEARAGLAIAREMPGEAGPDRLPEVLDRLRTHAAAGDARRKTARELGKLQV